MSLLRVCAALVSTVVACAWSSAAVAAVTAAFIDVDRTPLGAALEAKLLAATDVKWVERNQLDLMQKEQRLQAAFEPDGVAARLQLGKMLHADALVLLRRRGAAGLNMQSGYDLVVCQTQRGLRLSTQVLVESTEQPLDAAKLAVMVAQQLQKCTQPILNVYTVPPLVGRDLSYKFTHLQRGYAELLMERLLALPGIAVVETAEARAVAAERLLVGDAAGRADYDAPIFITGEFRHSGEGETQRIRIQLAARRGETAVGAPLNRELIDNDTAAALTAWIDELASAETNQTRAPPVDRDAEAKRLLDRGRELFVWGNRNEAWDLAEAGLLYRPDDLALRRLAFDAVSEIFHGHVLICRVRAEVWPPMRIAFLRTCDHLEFLAKHDDNMSTVPGAGPYWTQSYFGTMRSVKQPPSDEARTILEELAPLESEALVKWYRIRLERGFHRDAHAFLAQYLALLPPEKRHSEMVRHILEYPQGRDADSAIRSIIHRQFFTANEDKTPKLAILRELKTHAERPDLVALAARLEADTLREQALWAQLAAQDADKIWPDLSPPGAPFREIQWRIRRAPPSGEAGAESLEPLPRDRQALWLMPIGPRLDVAVNNLGVYLVREPGLLDPLWETKLTEPISSQEEPCFDGRYLWIMTIGSKRCLTVVDTTTGKIWRGPKNFELLDGLPADDPRARQQSWVMMTAIRPGEVFAAITYGRTLLARINFDPEAAQPISMTTVYECPENVGRHVDDWQNPKVSFKASYLTALPGSADRTQPPQYVLVGRKGVDGRSGMLTMNSNGSQSRQSPSSVGATPTSRPPTEGLMNQHPLLVDLSMNRVEVVQDPLMPAELSSSSTGVAVAGNQVFYTFGANYKTNVIKYQKYDVAAGTTTVLDADSPSGFVFFIGDETHVVGARWWHKKPGDQKFTRVTSNVPWTAVNLGLPHDSNFDEQVVVKFSQKRYSLERMYNSAHYGPVLLLGGMNVEGRVHHHYLQIDAAGPMTGRP